MISVGPMQDFRSVAWNSAPNGGVWAVQNTSAWPINQHPAYITKSHQKMIHNPAIISPSSSTIQWSNSWEPVIIQQQRPMKKPPTPPFTTSANVNVPMKGSKKIMENGLHSAPTPVTFEIPYDPSPALGISGPFQSSPILAGENENETEDSLIYGESPADDDEFGSLGRKKKVKPPVEDKQLIEDELSKQNLYKTELCRSFCETGICRYGHKCQFAHGELELRPVMRHPKYKTETCKTFSNTGTCPYGNRCRFIHPGVTFGSWPEDGSLSDNIIGSMDQLSISPTPLSQQPTHPHIHGFQIEQPSPPVVLDLKDKESDVKALVDEDADSKPRLAFFQNLTVI